MIQVIPALLSRMVLSAHAGEPVPMNWHWNPDQVHAFYLRATAEPATPEPLSDTMGRTVYASEIEVRLTAACQAAGRQHRRTEVACNVEHAIVSATPADGDTRTLALVMGEMEHRLERADVRVVVAPNGRVRDVVLHEDAWWEEGPARSKEAATVLASLAFEGLDMRIPSRAQLRRAYASSDQGVTFWHSVDAYDGERADIRSIGGDEFVQISGSAVFDLEAGALAERKWFASSSDDEGNVDVHHGYARLLVPTDIPWAIAAADDTSAAAPIIEPSLSGSSSAR